MKLLESWAPLARCSGRFWPAAPGHESSVGFFGPPITGYPEGFVVSIGGCRYGRPGHIRAEEIGSQKRSPPMTVARITEINASSPDGFEAAVKVGVDRAAKTLQNITGAWVQDQKVVVNDGAITEYRVNLKVSFILND